MHPSRPTAPAARPQLRWLATVTAVALLAPVLALLAPAPAQAATPVATARDAGTFASTLVPADHRYPTGTAPDERAVVRDCGFSTPLPGGVSLWLFCDTAVHDGLTGTPPDLTATTRFVPSGTAALAPTVTQPDASAPVELHEAAYPALPTRFVESSGRYGPPEDRRTAACPDGATTFAWTKGMVTLPGTSRVVGWFQDHCPDLASSFAEYDVGVTVYDAPAVGPADLTGDERIATTERYDSVLVNPAPASGEGWTYGQGPVVHGEHIYLYRSQAARFDCSSQPCTMTAPGEVTVARVTWADGAYTDGSRYEFYAGDGTWSADEADAVSVLPDTAWPSGDGMSVAWVPQVGRYVMSHANSRFAPTDGFSLRTAPTPWGPWSGPVDVAVDASSSLAAPDAGCTAPTSCRTFLLHPELTGGDELYVSYVRNSDLATQDGQPVTVNGRTPFQVRLAAVPLSVLPASAAETTITAAPPTHGPLHDAQVAFESPVRPADAAAPGGSTAGVTFTCALDGAPAAPCTSPLTLTGLSDGAHQVVVTAVSPEGVADPTPATATFAVDDTAPDTTVAQGPADGATPGASSFRFDVTDDQDALGDVRFECALDGAAFQACTNPWTATDATTGQRTLAVRAIDRAGNVDPSPATWTWSVDEPPVVTITSGPAPFVRWTTASISFTRTDDHTWTMLLDPECSLDGAPFTACSSPLSLSGLAEGDHEVAVRTTDDRGATTTATHAWTIDLTGPSAPTVAGLGAMSPTADPTVELAATDDRSAPGDLTFECSLDYATWGPCATPLALTGLADGYHRLATVTRDQAGNPSPTAVVEWTVDTVAPTVTGTGPEGTTTATAASAHLVGRDDRTWPDAMAYECRLDGAEPVACPADASFDGLRPGLHVLEASAVDAAGNRSAPLRWSWQIDYVVTPTPPSATTGVPYEHRLRTNATDLGLTERWTVAGTLPAGIRLWDGALVGTPSQAGTFGPIRLTATSEAGTATADVVLVVAGTDSITGTLTNAVTGAPVEGIRVQVFHSSGIVVATTTSAADGTYRTGYLRPGDYRLSYVDLDGGHVSAYGTGQASLGEAVPLTVADGTEVLADLALTPLTTIEGHVVDAATGAPLAGVWVTLFGPDGTSDGLRVTDETGAYHFRNLPAGERRLAFTDMSGQHRRTYWRDADALEAATPIVVGDGTPVVADAALEPVTAVSGLVIDDASGAPLPGIWVNLFDASDALVGWRVTDADGAYAFRNLPPGDYRVTFTDLGAAYAGDDATVAVVSGSVDASARLVQASTLTGTVTDEVTGAPLAGVWVLLTGADGQLATFRVTDEAGRWTMAGLAPGSYRVTFNDVSRAHLVEHWRDARDLASATVVDAAGAETLVLDAALTPAAAISGRVTDSVSGAPLAGARVSLVAPDGTGAGLAYTAADGTYRFGNLAPGDYRVAVGDPTGTHHATYWPAAARLADAQPVALGAGQSAVADVAMDPITVLTGTIRDATTGAPVAGAWAVLHAPDGTSLVLAATDGDGTYRFSSLRPGEYRLRVTDPAGRYTARWWADGASIDDATPVRAVGGTLVADLALSPR